MSDAAHAQPETPAADDLSGRQLGDFQLLRRLGQGAMAEVYLAEQCRLKRRVAVKILRRELAKDVLYLQRFQREAEAAASLVHANIVQIHEVGQIDGLHYIAQEYVQGQNLQEWIVRHGPAELPQALSIMRQAAAALAKAAQQGVVHRDIKPENIMLTAGGEVKVADFGLARLTRADEAAELTQVGMTLGTPLYMSPEQVEGRALDPRSDIYSLGVTCYHLLTGGPPFAGETALAVAVQHLKKEPKPLQAARPDLPPALCRLVHRMLAKDPAERWQSAREVLNELCRLYYQYGGPNPADPSASGQSSSGLSGMSEIDAWVSSGIDPLADTQLPAVRRLSGLMKTAGSGSSRRGWLAWLLGLVAASLAGTALAWYSMQRQELLARSPDVVDVPRQATVLRQWLYATQIGTAEAWRSVIEYFPEKEYIARRAQQQLARIYLRERNYAAALAIFQELADADDLDKEFRAFGLAGKCGVLTLQGEYQQSADVLDELWSIHQELRDVQMRRMLDYVMRENRAKLGPQTAQQWNEWLSEQFPPQG